MNKKYISLTIVLLLAIGMLPALFGNGETNLPLGNVFGEINGKNGCFNIKLLQSVNDTLQPDENATYYPPSGARDDCYYILDVTGSALNCGSICEVACQIDCNSLEDPPCCRTGACRDGCCCTPGACYDYCAYYNIFIKYKNEDEELSSNYHACGSESFHDILGIPGNDWKEVEYIRVENTNDSQCGITYTWKLYSACPCTGKQALYPKVDIEQFSVTGGDTIIKDGKILTNFNLIPGVQQTFIQVQNRGFFTQNDVKVMVIGLPQDVTFEITPNTQKIKAHKIGTYQATFEVGPNVPSGTYKINMMAYSDNGVFDTIQIDLIVP